MRGTTIGIAIGVCLVVATIAAGVHAACPDLEPQGLTLYGPQVVAPGEGVGDRLLAFVTNVGDTTAGAYAVALYISEDAIITTSDRVLNGARDFMDSLSPVSIEPLPPCASHYAGCDFLTIPADWPTGPAYIGIIVDEFLTVAECDENNNTTSIPVTVSSPGAAVLAVPGTYSTITDAIAAAFDGDTILIATGEYDEDFSVSKDLIFCGEGWDNTIIRTTDNDDYIVSVTNASVIFRDLQLMAWGSQPYWVSRGIDATDASLSVISCKFAQIGNHHIDCLGGSVKLDSVHMSVTGIVSDVGLSTESSVFCVRNSYGGNRIDHVYDPRLSSLGLIENNLIEGSNVYWANGIRVRDYSKALIRNNTIIGQHNESTMEHAAVGGIVAFGTCTAELVNNEVHGFVYGLNFGSGSTTKVHGNIVTSNILRGARIFASPNPVTDFGGGVLGSPGDNTIHSNGPYNVYSEYTGTIYARHNHWNESDSATIDATLYDDDEDPGLGEVLFMPFGNNTNTGIYVAVYTGLGVHLIYDSITAPGATYVELEEIGPPLPPVLSIIPTDPPIYYDIHTTAEYSGNIEVCISYDEAYVTGDEEDLRLYHYEDDQWVRLGGWVDTEANIVCCMTSSLSYFIVAEMFACCGQYTEGITGNANCSEDGKLTLSDITRMIDRVYISKESLCCEASGNTNADRECKMTLSDITVLIDAVYISKADPKDCMLECEL